MSATPKKDDDFVQRGAWGEVRHAKRLNGQMEAKAWLDSASDGEKAKFDHLFRRICAVGKISNDQQFRHLRGDIWEFKRDRNRILCFQEGRCWRLTHHYPKSGQKCPKTQIDRADQIQAEHVFRRAKK